VKTAMGGSRRTRFILTSVPANDAHILSPFTIVHRARRTCRTPTQCAANESDHQKDRSKANKDSDEGEASNGKHSHKRKCYQQEQHARKPRADAWTADAV